MDFHPLVASGGQFEGTRVILTVMPSPVVLHSTLYNSTHSNRGKTRGDKICECAFKMTSRGDQWVKIHKFGCVSQCYYWIGDVWRTLWAPIRELSPAQKKYHFFADFHNIPGIPKVG